MPSERERLLRLHFGNSSSSFHSDRKPLLRSFSNVHSETVGNALSSAPIRTPSKLIDTQEDIYKVFKKTGAVQNDLDNTVKHVHDILDNLLLRGADLNAMHNKFENLAKSAETFKRYATEHNEHAQAVHKTVFTKYYCWLILGAIPLLAIFYLAFILYQKYNRT